MEHYRIHSENAPAAIGPYSQGVAAGDMVFVSGQIGTDPSTNLVAETFEGQVYQIFKNLSAILTGSGMVFSNVVKTTVFLTDIGRFADMNKIYAEHFNGPVLPARSAVQVAALPRGAQVEIELIAMK